MAKEKVKTEGRHGAEETYGSQIFAPYRALGMVVDLLPIAVQHHAGESFIAASIGKSFHVYNVSKLKLVFVGPRMERTIACIAMWKRMVITADARIRLFHRGKLMATLRGHEGTVRALLVMGDYLVSTGDDKTMRVWNLRSCKEVVTIELKEELTPTVLLHPPTYVNKVIVGTEEGVMQLWNIRSQRLLYSFPSFGAAITCLEPSTALDVAAIGLADGRVIVHNLKCDKTIMQFLHNDGGPITALSFRSDTATNRSVTPTVVSGNEAGQVAVWNLQEQRLHVLMPDCHQGSVSSLHFMPGEPILLSSGPDNTLKVWIFDKMDGSARLLRSRSAHYRPPRMARFYKNAQQMLTVGEDRTMRAFFTFQDRRNCELSQGHIEKRSKQLKVAGETLKLTQCVSFAASHVRERDWNNIVSCHRNDSHAYLWSFEKKALATKASLRLLTSDPSESAVTAVEMSTCGNFAIVATERGWLEKFNVQSGMRRGSCSAHEEAVTSIVSDGLNKTIVTASLDGKVRCWDFKSMTLLHEVNLDISISHMILYRDSGLLAVASDDLVVRMFDTETWKLVRRFSGHTSPVTDMTFSPDCRWLVTSSMDSTVRVWSIVSGTLIDWFSVPSPVTSLTFSPSSEFLATTHLGDLAVYLWSNLSYFSTVFLGPVPEKPSLIALPTHITDAEALRDDEDDEEEEEEAEEEKAEEDRAEEEGEESDEEMGEAGAFGTGKRGADDLGDGSAPPKKKARGGQERSEDDEPSGSDSDEDSEEEEEAPKTVVPKLSASLTTFSGVPRSRVKALVNLEVIKERNKPKAPPKAPERAPFLLPTLGGLQPTFDTEEAAKKANAKGADAGTKILSLGSLQSSTAFFTAIEECRLTGDYTEAFEVLGAMSPSGMDLEVRQIMYEEQLEALFDLIEFGIDSGQCFELVQALLNVALKLHHDLILGSVTLQQRVRQLQNVQESEWDRLETMFQHSQCLVSFLAGLKL